MADCDADCGPVILFPSRVKVMFLLKIMLIYDDPLIIKRPPAGTPVGCRLMEVQLYAVYVKKLP